jgi:hypothetical protein
MFSVAGGRPDAELPMITTPCRAALRMAARGSSSAPGVDPRLGAMTILCTDKTHAHLGRDHPDPKPRCAGAADSEPHGSAISAAGRRSRRTRRGLTAGRGAAPAGPCWRGMLRFNRRLGSVLVDGPGKMLIARGPEAVVLLCLDADAAGARPMGPATDGGPGIMRRWPNRNYAPCHRLRPWSGVA